jgi:hypothetical protein
MDAREKRHVVNVNARPSSWPLVERPWLRMRARVRMPQRWSNHEGIAAHVAQPIDKLRDRQLLARTGVAVTSNCATSTAPIQYP